MVRRPIPVPLLADIESPTLHFALSSIVPQLIIAEWDKLAAGHEANGDYRKMLASADALKYPYEGNPDSVGVINTSRHADWLENGRGGFHLPSHWTRWIMGKNGPYAHVLFRIYTPTKAGDGATTRRRRTFGSMPPEVYERARRELQGPKDRLTGFGDLYKVSRPYEIHRRMGDQNVSSVDSYTWVASQFEGMFASIQSTSRKPRDAQYFTIRTIKPDSPGWYIPPMPALHLAERALDAAMPQVTQIVEDAAVRDLEVAMIGAMEGLV